MLLFCVTRNRYAVTISLQLEIPERSLPHVVLLNGSYGLSPQFKIGGAKDNLYVHITIHLHTVLQNHLVCVLCIMICILSSRSNPHCVCACVCVFVCERVCMPLCRARIFCCCCSSNEVSAFTCFSVSSKATAFSRWPRVYGRDTHCQHFFMSNSTHTHVHVQLSSAVALHSNNNKVNNNSGTTLESL